MKSTFPAKISTLLDSGPTGVFTIRVFTIHSAASDRGQLAGSGTAEGVTMSRDELVRLYDAGDWYGLLLAVGRAWLARYHPEAQYAATAVHIGRGVPEIIIPLLASSRGRGASSPLSTDPA